MLLLTSLNVIVGEGGERMRNCHFQKTQEHSIKWGHMSDLAFMEHC